MFKGAKLSQDLSVTKSCFECSIWIVSVMHTTGEKVVILMLIQNCFLLHEMFCHEWKELALFQAAAQYKALEDEHTPH